MCYTEKQYNNRVAKLMELETQKKELEKRIKELQDDIKSDMGETETIETNLFKIHFTTVLSNKFDSRRFKTEHAALYNEYMKPIETRRFSWSAI